MARLLTARGWQADRLTAENFLTPMLKHLRSPFDLLDMDAAVDRTHEALRTGQRICVYGDYDVDGVTSTALMVGVLKFLGVEPSVVIPHRINDGYGMNVSRVEQIAAEGCQLIITVDTGISAVAEIRRARELGIDVVVTDHHLAVGELPMAAALVNPNRSDGLYEPTRLCGVGVAFKFAHALLKKSSVEEAEAKKFLLAQLDLVALGTVADVVPLTGENRVLVRHGLEAILGTRRPGLRALLEMSRFNQQNVTPELIGFGLGPRLNAAGRTNDPTLAFRLLMTTDAAEASMLARRLDELNTERREIESDILDASVRQADDFLQRSETFALVIGGQGWHLGVVGIVAGRLTERYDVPAIVLACDSDHAKGSARSVPGFDIHEALIACGEHLLSYGGHSAAAGLKLKTNALPKFREAVNSYAQDLLRNMDRTRTIHVDAEVDPGEVTWSLYGDLQKLQPHGEGNPEPLFLMRSVESATQPRIVGRNHLKMRLRVGGTAFDAIGFSLGHLKPTFESGRTDILFRPRENHFNGMSSLELELVDGRPAAR
ncbi:single-stranded-DNA-specific exonuclease RecJ [Candidatus Sumerlaeota bacterium]|nr:single-stranded-DNA-specific exonuclease RecJ [Candidatus Sumerlaeota bacterium]